MASLSVTALGPALADKIVYIVDDDVTVRRSVKFYLETLGYVARPFLSGLDLLDEIEALAPGCILLDIRMPDADGLEIMERLVPYLDRITVIVMTGHGDVTTAVRAMKLGAIDFLEKPFEEAVLVETLEHGFDTLCERRAEAIRETEAVRLVAALTDREREVLAGLVAGLGNKAIANALALSVRTVEMHRAHMMTRLSARSISDALRLAFLADVKPLEADPGDGEDDGA